MFVGEEGSDTGGLTREFFRLIQYSMSKYMEVQAASGTMQLHTRYAIYMAICLASVPCFNSTN